MTDQPGKINTYDTVEEWLDSFPPWTLWDHVKYHARRLRELPRNTYLKIKWFIQRGRRGYADYDLWNWDGYMAQLISTSLTHLNEIKHGWPGDEIVTWEQYTLDIQRIADAFKQHAEFIDGTPTVEEHNAMKTELHEAFQLLEKYFPTLWD